tara:strand:+ start:255 stop:722 length:468 start_codon:yes stop_codon:yes gene_type:complete
MYRTQPISANLKAGEIIRSGGRLLVNDGANNTFAETAAGQIALGVSADESSRAAVSPHAYETTGATVGYYPLGGVMLIQVDAASTFNIGGTVYVGSSGLATSSDGGGAHKKLGIYVGDAAHAATALSEPLGGNEGQSGATEGALIRVNTNSADIA